MTLLMQKIPDVYDQISKKLLKWRPGYGNPHNWGAIGAIHKMINSCPI